jgi:DNA segregation ATPase FtsK/SpoIIIE-like protein
MDDDSIILENIEDIDIETNSSKKLDKKEYAKQEQKRETEEKNLKQKTKLLEHENQEIKQKLEKEKSKNNKEENQELNNALENVDLNKKIPKKQDQEKSKNNENEILKNIENVEKDKKTNLNQKVKKKEQNESKEKANKPKINLVFEVEYGAFCNQIKHILIADMMHFIVLFDINSCRKFVVYDNNVDCILINTYHFIHNISLLISDENQREAFIDEIFSDKKRGLINNDFLTKIIEKINHAGSFKFGSPVLNQEIKDKKIINFRAAKIFDEKENRLYKGTFLYMFMKNENLKKSLNKNGELDVIIDSEYSVKVTDDDAAKIVYEDVII